jgi:hypothetical protein
MTDDEVLAQYRHRYRNVGLETARALQRMSGYRGTKRCGPPGGLADDLPPRNPSGPPLRIAEQYAAGRPRPTVSPRDGSVSLPAVNR